jgi:hypothetical protein
MRSSPLRHLALLFVVLLLAGGVLACELPGGLLQPTTGPSKPTVSISAPTSGSEFQVGEQVNVLCSARDARGVARLELYVDGTLYRTDPSPNLSGDALVSLSQTWIADDPGTHTLSVVAVNVDGVESDPWAITVRVTGEIAPPLASPTVEEVPLPSVTPTVAPPPPVATATSPPPTPTVDPDAPIIKYFRANGQDDKYTAARGERVTLSWEWAQVESGYLDPGNWGLPCPAMPCTFIVVPEGTTTYTLRAINSHATTEKSVTVEIK